MFRPSHRISLIGVNSNVRCRKTNMIRRIIFWTVFMTISAYVWFVSHIQLTFVAMMSRTSRSHNHVFQFDAFVDQNSSRNVIISGYGKGAGNIVGKILGSRPETFYTNEPLVDIGESQFFKNSTTACTTSPAYTCFPTTLTETALDRIRNVMSCSNASMVGDEYHTKWDNGGQAWIQYRDCLLYYGYSNASCFKYLSDSCKQAKVKVTKLERLSTELLGVLLKEHEYLSVVHIFRDPRGIINTHIKSRFSILSNSSSIREYAQSLCSRMRDDLQAGNKLAEMYPKRFKLLLYEDFRLDMVNVVRPLFRFLGLPLATQDKGILETMELNLRSTQESVDELNNTIDNMQLNSVFRLPITKSHPFSWRLAIEMDALTIIDNECKNLYVELGYNVYENEHQLRNITQWPSYSGGGIYPL